MKASGQFRSALPLRNNALLLRSEIRGQPFGALGRYAAKLSSAPHTAYCRLSIKAGARQPSPQPATSLRADAEALVRWSQEA